MTGQRARVVRATPVVQTADYARARRFYVERLGFALLEEAGDPAGFGIFQRGEARIFVDGFRGVVRSDAVRDHGWDAFFHVEGLAALARELAERGAPLEGEITTTNYDMRELEVVDPDGNRLCFGEDVD